MKTEEQQERLTDIIEKYADNRQEYYESGKPTDPHYGATALKAIEKLIEERCIGFAEWVVINYWRLGNKLVPNISDGTLLIPSYTTSELYALFLTNKNKTYGTI